MRRAGFAFYKLSWTPPLLCRYASNSGVLATWTNSDPCAGWVGVTCVGTAVTELKLCCYGDNGSPNGLRGTLPSEIGMLASLTYMDLGGNSLSSTLPTQLGALVQLTLLSVGNNAFSGTLPTELALLSQVSTFYVIGNHCLFGDLVSVGGVGTNYGPAVGGGTTGTNLTLTNTSPEGCILPPSSPSPSHFDTGAEVVSKYGIRGFVSLAAQGRQANLLAHQQRGASFKAALRVVAETLRAAAATQGRRMAAQVRGGRLPPPQACPSLVTMHCAPRCAHAGCTRA